MTTPWVPAQVGGVGIGGLVFILIDSSTEDLMCSKLPFWSEWQIPPLQLVQFY